MLLSWMVVLVAGAPSVSLSFDEAIALSLTHPEGLALEKSAAARKEGDAELSSLAHAPQLTISPGWRISPDGDRGPEILAGIQQSWSLGGFVGARREAAQSEREALDGSVRAKRLEERLEAARAWIDLASREQETTLVEAEVVLAQQEVERVERAIRAGFMTADDVAEARAYAAEAELVALEVEGAQFLDNARLGSAVGLPGGTELRTLGPAPSAPIPDQAEWPALVTRAHQLPSAEQERLTALATRARAIEIAAQAGPTLSTGLSAQRESPESWLLWLNLGVTLPVFERDQRGRSLAEAEAIAAEQRAKAASLMASHLLAQALHEVEHSAAQEEILKTKVLPELERLVALRRRALEAGEGTMLPLLAAQRRSIQAQRTLLRQTADRRWSAVKAWLLLSELSSSESS